MGVVDSSPGVWVVVGAAAGVAAVIVTAVFGFLTLRAMAAQRNDPMTPRVRLAPSPEEAGLGRSLYRVEQGIRGIRWDATLALPVRNAGAGTARPVWISVEHRDMRYETVVVAELSSGATQEARLLVMRYRAPRGNRSWRRPLTLLLPRVEWKLLEGARVLPGDALSRMSRSCRLIVLARDDAQRWWRTSIALTAHVAEDARPPYLRHVVASAIQDARPVGPIERWRRGRCGQMPRGGE